MSTDRPNGSLYTNINNRIATVEFGHPASNSFVSELLQRLTSEINQLSSNDEVSIIVLKSEGERAFCAGASFDELAAISNLDEGKAFFSGFANVINAMRSCNKPIIGRVQGKVVGGGVGLVATCDYVFATEAASIKLSEISIGIAPLVIAPAVERKIGKGGLAELALSPTEWKNAYWVKEKGLFSKVFDTIKALDKELDDFSLKLASYNLEALTAMKKVMWEGTENWSSLLLERAEQSGRLALSEATKAALAKFKK
ncbi:enoyl-CoA hydratase/isomerase family protein [uncultured Croceitalea sp.]|uniref:enoyl-CoA hydratase/isomerase family protein n=1 Tax=uncultured Croceitalea sp. TaxID=1798908 RepID=UPI00374FC025